jgi:transcriptional regulator with XRE-family HTH domain
MSAVNKKILVLSIFVQLHKRGVFILSTINKISELLSEQGKTQKELTDYLGITKNAFTDWKSGRIKSYNKHLDKIAEFFGVSVDYLLGKTPSPEREDIPEDEKRLRDLLSQMSEEQLQTALKIISAIAEEK